MEKETDTDANVIFSVFTITTIIVIMITIVMRTVQGKHSFGSGMAVNAKSVLGGGRSDFRSVGGKYGVDRDFSSMRIRTTLVTYERPSNMDIIRDRVTNTKYHSGYT